MHGADLDVFATEYAGAACSLLGVLTKAKHPLAAQLFALWLLGAEGQDILWASSFVSWGRGTQRLGKLVRDMGIEVIWETPENYARRADINGQLRKALGFS
jgi:ABC-type Fe3+ transport system substrate-binding protein